MREIFKKKSIMKQIDLFFKSLALFLFAMSIASYTTASKAYMIAHQVKPDFIPEQPVSGREVIVMPKHKPENGLKTGVAHKLPAPRHESEPKKDLANQKEDNSSKGVSLKVQKVAIIPEDVKIENLDTQKASEPSPDSNKLPIIQQHRIKLRRIQDLPDTSMPN